MKPLKIMVLEDSVEDVFLIERELRKSGLQFNTLVVEDEAGFERALTDFEPDVVLSDHSLTGFSVEEAFEIYKRHAQRTGVFIPFILVSGMVPEDLAVEMNKARFDDYILKDRLKRLPLAIENAIGKCRIDKERLQYMQQLKVKEALIRDAEEIACSGCWQVDLSTGEHTWSDTLYLIYGFKTGEVAPGEDVFLRLAHPDDRDALRSGLRDIFDGPDRKHWDVRIIDNRGNLKYLSSTLKVVRDATGTPTKVLGVNLDVTDRKNAEMALKKQEQEYWSLFHENPDPIISLSRDGGVTNVNKALMELSGFSEEKLKQEGYAFLFHPDDVPLMHQYFLFSLQRKSQRYGVRLVNAAGAVVFLDVSSIPVVVEGEVIGVHLVAKDISGDIHDRKLAEIAVREAYGERMQILESIGDAFFAVDKNWVVTYWNKHAEAILGMPRERIIGKNLWETYTDAVPLSFFEQYHKAMEGNFAVHFAECYATLGLWIDVSAYPSPSGLSIYFKDVTEQKKRAEELHAQNIRLQEIAWMQSHELRGPLARILGLTNLLMGGGAGDDSELLLAGIENSAAELDRVVRKIVQKTEAEADAWLHAAGEPEPLLRRLCQNAGLLNFREVERESG